MVPSLCIFFFFSSGGRESETGVHITVTLILLLLAAALDDGSVTLVDGLHRATGTACLAFQPIQTSSGILGIPKKKKSQK